MAVEILVSWLGRTDRENLETYSPAGSRGPLLSVLHEHDYDELHLLIAWKREDVEKSIAGLRKACPVLKIKPHFFIIDDPTDYKSVFQATASALKTIDPYNLRSGNRQVTFFVTPGTPMMIAVLCMVAERIPGIALIQSSHERGTRFVEWFLPEYVEGYKSALNEIGNGVDDAFGMIKYASPEMQRVLQSASRFAKYDIRVMLLGESGTGKELIAGGIHKASGRCGNFVAINCGAIPANLIESELFGYAKGAFTGANSDRDGKIVEADNGTLFLDEIGELALDQQVKLLRVLQENEVTPVGGRPRKVNVRVITATHRNLAEMVRNGGFRLDLYYRLAVGVIRIPPLRERGLDILLLAETCLEKINKIVYGETRNEYKFFEESAKTFMLECPWRGNFRELENAIFQAHINSNSKCIGRSDIQGSLISLVDEADISFVPDGNFKLDDALNAISKKYIDQAMAAAHGNKTLAAKLLGLPSHQTLSNRMAKIGKMLDSKGHRDDCGFETLRGYDAAP